MSEKTVFLSYRRDSTGKAFAGRIHDALKQQGYDVFLDVNNLGPGSWETQILTEVPKRAHYVLVLTPNSLDRCADPQDWVRREYELATSSGRNIVPVLEESVPPHAAKTSAPPSMLTVFAFATHGLSHANFATDIDRLIGHYIPPHKAPPPSLASGIVAAVPPPSRRLLLSLLEGMQTPLFNRLIDMLFLAAVMLTLIRGIGGDWNVVLSPFALALKGFVLLLGLPEEVVPAAQVALCTITCGVILMLSHAKMGSKPDMSNCALGLVSAAFGIGIAGTLVYLRGGSWQRNRII
jgi:hypothetical protein